MRLNGARPSLAEQMHSYCPFKRGWCRVAWREDGSASWTVSVSVTLSRDRQGVLWLTVEGSESDDQEILLRYRLLDPAEVDADAEDGAALQWVLEPIGYAVDRWCEHQEIARKVRRVLALVEAAYERERKL